MLRTLVLTTALAVAAAAGAQAAAFPVNPGAKRLSELQFSPEDTAAKAALRKLMEVDCRDCEGGIDIEHPRKVLALRDYGQFERKVVGLAVGEALPWTGKQSAGTITMVGEAPMARTVCKTVRWEVTRRGPKPVKAQAPGLYCQVGSGWEMIF